MRPYEGWQHFKDHTWGIVANVNKYAVGDTLQVKRGPNSKRPIGWLTVIGIETSEIKGKCLFRVKVAMQPVAEGHTLFS